MEPRRERRKRRGSEQPRSAAAPHPREDEQAGEPDEQHDDRVGPCLARQVDDVGRAGEPRDHEHRGRVLELAPADRGDQAERRDARDDAGQPERPFVEPDGVGEELGVQAQRDAVIEEQAEVGQDLRVPEVGGRRDGEQLVLEEQR